eukprot:TRINITY_DN5089_c0_g1_i12.p1 TRINITY_DN5089_c0_g1~~TRINITY_DN5089_c0_g1_i12.p1  ORF type:complete len:196 (-),score=28.95 TRINITY_DN5089_c0_g1_i12:47-634(-)
MRVNRDLAGMLCVCAMFFFLFSVDAVVCYLEVFKVQSYLHVVLFNILTLLVVWAYIAASCSDPGFLPKNYRQLDSDLLPLNVTGLIEKTIKNINSLSTNQTFPNDIDSSAVVANPVEEATIRQLLKVCGECNVLNPPCSYHCRSCNRCVARCNTHYTWINNCIGYYNQRPFIVFLVYLIIPVSYTHLTLPTNREV